MIVPSRKPFAVLLLFWAGLLPLFGLWLWRDRGISPWDLSVHARLAYQAWGFLRHFKIAAIYTLSDYYPPLFHIAAAPLALLSSHPDVYCAANWFFLLALMWAVWLAGRRLAGDAAGLAAACLLPAYVYITMLCHQPMIDLALTAMVACTLSYLICCPPPDFPRHPHALGLCLAGGLLAKWVYPFFVALPLLYYFVLVVRALGWRARALRMGLLKAAAWPLLLAGPWYVRAIPIIAGKAPRQLSGEVARMEGDPAVFSWTGLTHYARQIDWAYTRTPLLALLLAGAMLLVLFALKKRFAAEISRGWTILLLSFFSGYAVLTLIANKDPRYIMPLMIVAALVSTHWVGRLGPRWRIAAAAAMLLLSYAAVANNLFRLAPPDTRNFKVEALADWIAAQPRLARRVRVGVIPNDWHLNGASLNYALLRRKPKYGARYAKESLNSRLLRDYEYIIVTDPPGESSGVAPNMLRNTEFMRTQPGWKIATTIQRDDKVKLVVLEKTN